MKLSDIQSQFQHYLLQPNKKIPPFICGSLQTSAFDRLAVYATAYRLRLLEALAIHYPALQALIGEDAFEAMAMGYRQAHPSTYRSIRWFGDKLPTFLNTTMPYAKKKKLAEMAEFEWCLSYAFDASNAPLIDINKVEQLAPDIWSSVQFVFSPTLQQLNLQWRVVPFWQAVQNQHALPMVTRSRHFIPWIVWRKELDVLFRSSSIAEAQALSIFSQGGSFEKNCERLSKLNSDPQLISHIASWLKSWMLEGICSDFIFIQ